MARRVVVGVKVALVTVLLIGVIAAAGVGLHRRMYPGLCATKPGFGEDYPNRDVGSEAELELVRNDAARLIDDAWQRGASRPLDDWFTPVQG